MADGRRDPLSGPDRTAEAGSTGAGRAAGAYAPGYAPPVTVVPEVLSFREFRAGLAATLRRVQEPGAGPVFVGAHRRAQAVVLSAAEYERLRGAAGRREAVDAALASVRLEGLEPSTEGHRLLDAYAAGRLDADEAVEQLARQYRR